jgi:hypothetical protein
VVPAELVNVIRSPVPEVTATPVASAMPDAQATAAPGRSAIPSPAAISHGTPLLAGRVTCTLLVFAAAAVTWIDLIRANEMEVLPSASVSEPARSRSAVADAASVTVLV